MELFEALLHEEVCPDQVQELQGDQQTVEDVVRGEELDVAGSIVQGGVEDVAGVNTTSGENICRISKNIWITRLLWSIYLVTTQTRANIANIESQVLR